MPFNVEEWNNRIYRNADGSFVEGGLNAKEFFEEFGIESFPLFRDKCYYHVPERWADDVRIFIKQAQTELGHKFVFTQIKEKFCWLTVYYTPLDESADNSMKELINKCIDRLIEKGVHPPREIKGESHD
jgi:hypothetical protein